MKTNPVSRVRCSNIKLLLTTIGLLVFQCAHATLYLSEPFDYPAGPLTNAIPWSTNGTAIETGIPTLQLISGDLSYPPLTDPLPINHSCLQFSTSVKGERQISGGPIGGPGSGQSIYASFIFYEVTTNGQNANSPIVGLCVNSTETINQAAVNGPVLYYQQIGGLGNYHLGIKVGGGTTGMAYPPGTQVYTAGNTSAGTFGQTNFVVMKYTFSPTGTAGSDTVQLWVNPDPGSFGGSEPAATTNDVAAINNGTDASTGLDYFQIRGGASAKSGTSQIDNILVGSTWADVTPTCVTAGTSIPANQSVSPGQMATFSIIPTGSSPTFQWQTNNGASGWVNIGGATNSSYITPAEILADNGLQFRCIVNVSCDGSSVTSAAATLTVQTCVTAGTTNPNNQSITAGHTATFSVIGNGTSPTYQWQTNSIIGGGGTWVNINGATSSSYTTPPEIAANDGLQFRCVVHVACDGSSATSAAATLSVTCTTAAVTTNPLNPTKVNAGQTATFSIVGSGSDLTYQWATNNGGGWINIPGATNSTYTTAPEVTGDFGLLFQCSVMVACDHSTNTSAAAELEVFCDTAQITANPADQGVGVGQTATFAVTATGTSPAYQWQTNNGGVWGNISGATNSSYTTPPETLSENGRQFQCTVSVACDGSSQISSAATLSVSPGTAWFQSITSGNINDPNTWQQSFDGGVTWTTPALYAPTDVNSTNVTVQNGNTVVNSANWQLDQLVVQTGGQITINASTTLTITNGTGTDLDISGTVDATGTLAISSGAAVVVESGGVLINEQGGTETVAGTLTFNSGGNYQHNYKTTVGTIPTATWNTGSTCTIIGYTTDTTTFAGQGQAFYNFIWNCPNQTSALPWGGTVPTAINGDFNVISTGTGEIRLANGNSPTLNIAGNLNIQGGWLTLASGAGKPVLNVSNNVNITSGVLSNNISTNAIGGTINFAKAGTQTFTNGGIIAGNVRWVVNSGSTLNGGSSALSTNLTLATGGQIRVTTNTPLFTVNGSLTSSNGTVVIDLGGATVGLGSYPLFNYTGSRSGSLNPAPSFVSGGISTGTALIDASTPGQIRLTVVNPRTPAIAGFSLSGTTLTFGGTNGTLNGSYGILASTNVALPLVQWTPVYLNGLFDGSGGFSASLDLTNTLNNTNASAPQQFFIMKSPTP